MKYFLIFVLLMIQGCNENKGSESKAHLNQGIAFIAALEGSESKKGFDKLLKNAEIEFSEAIKLDPSNHIALMNRGVVYITMGKLNKAEIDLNKSLALSPNDADTNYNLACLHSLTNKLDLSLEYLDAALRNGFNDFNRLREDADLKNLRQYEGFKTVLEANKVFL